MKLILKDNKNKIGVVRNPYERVVTEYFYSFNYIGFDKWLTQFTPAPQVELYKNCDIIINFDDWQKELQELNLQPKDTSILDDVKEIDGWRNWYTLHSRSTIGVLYKEDIITYCYSY